MKAALQRRSFEIAGIALATALVTYLFTLTLGDAGAGGDYRSPRWAVILHVATVVPGVAIGGALLAMRKGGSRHRQLGWMWFGLMATTSVSSFWVRSSGGEFSAIHLFSVAMLVALPVSLWRIRARDASSHRQIQLSLYIGLLVAGAFAFSPDREIGRALLDLSRAA
jgi:uncharacterized membrane protein